MKAITKFLLVGAVAVTAIAISVAPSEAAKKKRARAMAPCTIGALCTGATFSPGASHIMVCGGDGKWYQALFTPVCLSGTPCPAAC